MTKTAPNIVFFKSMAEALNFSNKSLINFRANAGKVEFNSMPQ